MVVYKEVHTIMGEVVKTIVKSGLRQVYQSGQVLTWPECINGKLLSINTVKNIDHCACGPDNFPASQWFAWDWFGVAYAAY